jgi:pimeloyl-ACP methyl ester carboxylesterase
LGEKAGPSRSGGGAGRAAAIAAAAAVVLPVLAGAGCGRLHSEAEIAQMTGREPHPFLQTRTVDAGGVPTRYADLGQGEALVLLHGFPETLQGWRSAAPGLAEHFRVLVPDVIGAGQTGKPPIDYTALQMAEHLAAFLDVLNVKKAHIVGTDTGLLVAVAFAAQYPERTGRLVLAAGTTDPRDFHSWEIRLMCIRVLGEIAVYNPFLGMVMKGALRKGFVERRLVSREMHAECMRSIRSPGGRRAALRTMRSFVRGADPLDLYLLKIKAPALVIFGEADRYFPLETGKRFAARLNAPIEVIPACGHFLQEERPDEFNRLVLKFLQGGEEAPE